MSVTTPDPLETREFWNLMMDFHRAPLATLETPAHRALRNYLRPFLKPPGPPVGETTTQPGPPTPREVRREFVDGDGGRVVALIDRDGGMAVSASYGGDDACFPVALAPTVARLILEVHAEATANPGPPQCPYCGGAAAAAAWDSGSYVGVCVAPACVARGPSRPTGAEAVAAFAGPRKGEA